MEYLKKNIKDLNLTQNNTIGTIDFLKINPDFRVNNKLYPFLSDKVASLITTQLKRVYMEAKQADYYDFYEVLSKSVYDKLNAINAFVIERSNRNESIEEILTEREYLASLDDVIAFVKEKDNKELAMPTAYESDSVKYLIKKSAEKISKVANASKIIIAITIALMFIKSYEADNFNAVTFIVMGISLILLLVVTFIEARKNSLLSENDIARENDMNKSIEYARYNYIPGTATLSNIISNNREAEDKNYYDYKKYFEVYSTISAHEKVLSAVNDAEKNTDKDILRVRKDSILSDIDLAMLIVQPVEIRDNHFDILIKLIYDSLQDEDKKDYEEKVVTRFYKKDVTDTLNKAKSERAQIFKDFKNSQDKECMVIDESYIKKFRNTSTLKCIALTAVSIVLSLVVTML